ncbi:MAG TPA: universal stress protein UspA [Actinobacteria bacterium]|jgi:nucleotide-binding universal stress UspA family protein|nr:universal stress protein UspA [Actinomycetota bacterium]
MQEKYREDLRPWRFYYPSGTIKCRIRKCLASPLQVGASVEYAGRWSAESDKESAMNELKATEEQTTGPVVVGVDGSIASERALLWAAEHAFRMGAGLRVVLVRTHPVPVTSIAPAPVWPWPVVHHRDEQGAAETREMLAEIVTATIPAKYDDNVKVDVVDGDSASSIIEVAREHRAALIVVGRRGRGGFKRLLLGSVSDEVATYAPCPVVVTGKHSEWTPQSTIVVGVDGSADSDRALKWAANQAQLVGSRLHVVHAWEPPYAAPDSLAGTMPFLADDQGELAKHAQKILSDSIARCVPDGSDLTVTSEVLEGYPSAMLTEVASGDHAELLVIGTRGLGGFSSMLLGSVAHQCLHHAVCPVAVIRPSDGQ